MTTMIAIPAGRAPSWALLASLWNLENRDDVFLLWNHVQMRVDDARGWLLSKFLESDAEWLLWLDSDATIAPRTITRLQSWAEPVVGALCFNRRQPVFPVAYGPHRTKTGAYVPLYGQVRAFLNAHEELFTNQAMVLESRPDDSLLQVDATGCHCLMTHRAVYEAIEPPYFQVNDDERWHGEDVYFLKKVQSVGMPVFIDMSVLSGHMAGSERSVGAVDFIASAQITTYKGDEK